MKWRYLVLGAILGAAVTYAAASYGGSDGVKPHVQTGKLLFINGVGMPYLIGFVFQPDGKSPDQNGSPTGTRSMAWSSEWARCDLSGQDCTWMEGDQPPRCVHAGARVELAWLNVKGTLYDQTIVWLKCLLANPA